MHCQLGLSDAFRLQYGQWGYLVGGIRVNHGVWGCLGVSCETVISFIRFMNDIYPPPIQWQINGNVIHTKIHLFLNNCSLIDYDK